MKEYVLGFVLDRLNKRVLLIRKNRPEWQNGYFNGIGGKVEPLDSTPHHAMVRECEEETSVKTIPTDWYQFCTMAGINCPDGDWMVYCYFININNLSINPDGFITNEDQFVDWFSFNSITVTNSVLLGNIAWLVSMAVDSMINGNFHTATIPYTGGFSLPLNL